MAKAVSIKISSIIIDDATHPRDEISTALVTEYAEAMQADAKFPPIIVYQDGNKFYLADGRHRLEAVKFNSKSEILAEIIKGSKRDAILAAVNANATHGIRRTNADKRKAVKILLSDKEWRTWTISSIAKKCNVSDGLVTAVWKDCQEELHLSKLEDVNERKFERDGQVIKQKTGNIGKKKSKSPTKAEDTSSARTLNSVIESVNEARDKLASENKLTLIKRIDVITEELQDILGKATGAKYRITKGLNRPLNVYEDARVGGIQRSLAFEKKGLATHSLCVGKACGHQCVYCSAGSNLFQHAIFADIHQTAFQKGFAIVDPNTAKRVLKNIPKLTSTDVIQFSTTDDGWSPEARKYNIGRETMKALLENTPAQIRVLTKSAEVAKDFDLFARYKDRVIVSLSTGIPQSKGKVANVIEPNASPIRDRLEALKKANKMGIRTFGMLCPCLPHIASSTESLEEMFDAVIECGVEAIWLEPVNGRSTLPYTEQQLRREGFKEEASAIEHIRKEANWSLYTLGLLQNAIKVAEEKDVLDKLHILLYSSSLNKDHAEVLKKHGQEIIWLDEEKENKVEAEE